jgi:fibronectin-binding autotransporter adhesin
VYSEEKRIMAWKSSQNTCRVFRIYPPSGWFFCLLYLLVLAAPIVLRAQLVPDGQTGVLDGVITNISGGLTIGTNEPFTTLIITNGAAVTNSSSTAIGLNASADTNLVVVTGAGSSLDGTGVTIGQGGWANELDILNGGLVTGAGTIGNRASASNNLVVISGAGSAWTNCSGFNVGNSGSRNCLILTNGGRIWITGNATIGYDASTVSNSIVVTGTNSEWTSGYFYLGYIDQGCNRLSINNGGAFTTTSTCDIGVYCNSNVLTVADPGSSLTCNNYRLGYSSVDNQCIVSNGARLVVNNSSSLATVVEGGFTAVTITGAGSLWTNNVDFDFDDGSNTLQVFGGGRLADDDGYVQGNNGGPDTVTVAGTNSMWYNTANLYLADSGTRLFITNGGTVSDNIAYIGENSGNHNCFALVDGAGSLWTNRVNNLDGNNDGALYLDENGGTNTLMVSDSGEAAAPDIYVNNNGRLVVANSGILLAVRDTHNGSSGGLYIGNNSSPNQMIISNNAVVNVGFLLQIGNFLGGSQASNTVTINGATMIVSNGITVASPGSLVLNSGTFLGGVFFISNYGMQTNAIVFNGGTLQAEGISYTFSSYPLPLLVGDGVHSATFQMVTNSNNLNSGTFAGGFNVSSNAWLTGGGIVNGNITVYNGGTFAPGITNLATVTLNGNLVLDNSSIILMGLQPSTASACSVQGLTNVVYGGTLQLANLGGTYQVGQSFPLFSASQYSGAFAALSPATPGSGLLWDTYALNANGTLRIVSTNQPPPAISGLTQSGGSLTITGTDGLAYDPCYLLTSTNLTAPNWIPVATNYFDATGTVNFTNPVSTSELQRYFELQAN